MNSDEGERVLILGSEGQLGSELNKIFTNAMTFSHHPGRRDYLDFCDLEHLQRTIASSKPSVIINTAAVTGVDQCESDKSNAYLVNGLALKIITKTARETGSKLIQVSTDYIFDGERGLYKEDDVPNPISFYGLSKLIGETYVQSYDDSLVIRTSGVFGSKKNFPLYVFDQLSKKLPVQVMEIFYSPIHARNLAIAIGELLAKDSKGIINVAGERISRHKLALEICRKYKMDDTLIHRVEKLEPLKAKRPYDSSLDISKAMSALKYDFYSLKSNLDAFDNSIVGLQDHRKQF